MSVEYEIYNEMMDAFLNLSFDFKTEPLLKIKKIYDELYRDTFLFTLHSDLSKVEIWCLSARCDWCGNRIKEQILDKKVARFKYLT